MKTIRPGSVVAFWENNALALAVVGGEERQRIRLVLPRGREVRVKESRILFEVGPPAEIPGKALEERRRAGERVAGVSARVESIAGTIEVPLLWEIVDGGNDEEDAASRPVVISELCGLALEADGGEERAAVVGALLADGLHFVRKGDDWEPRTAQVVQELKREREQVALRERRSRELFDALAATVAGEPYRSPGSDMERRYLDALEELAMNGEMAQEASRGPAREALTASGLSFDRPHEGAFRLLCRVGRFTEDENLAIRRYRLRTDFPAEVIEAARELAAVEPDLAGREDLTGLESVSIDGPATREIDDLVSLTPGEQGLVTLGIHIADPAARLRPGHPVDREAMARAVTHYLPERRINMLPASLSEEVASLVVGQSRPALSFLVDLDAEGRLVDHRIRRSVVRSSGRLDYRGVDRTLEQGDGPHLELLQGLARTAAARRSRRVEQGAIVILAPEVEVHVGEDGNPTLSRHPADSEAQRIVSEAMILASDVAARFCEEQGLPAIYRRQAPPDRTFDLPADGVRDPIAVRAVRRSLRRAEATLNPSPHHALGLASYVRITSPLRRYQDLVGHRQIAAVLDGRTPTYDADELQRIAATADAAEVEARRAERESEDFWMLRYLEQQVGSDLEGLVVAVEPRPVVQLVDCLREQPMPALAGVELGERVTLRVERVVPRAGLLVLLRREPGSS